LICADSVFRRRMRKTLHSPEYKRFLTLLTELRTKAGITQQILAEKLGRAQSFVAKYENGERRIDIVEFVTIAHALDADPLKLFREFLAEEAAAPIRKAGKRRSRPA
jgi:transcriptional regulator with XRE-family HTH domain